jgi:hypothetical protein
MIKEKMNSFMFTGKYHLSGCRNLRKTIGFVFLILAIEHSAQDIHLYGHIKDQQSMVVLRDIKVEIYANDKMSEQMDADSSGKYDFKVPLGAVYDIWFSRRGYFSKSIRIDARGIPDSLIESGFEMQLDGTLFRKVRRIDPKVFEPPMSIAVYSSEIDNFLFDWAYSAKRQEEIELAFKNRREKCPKRRGKS